MRKFLLKLLLTLIVVSILVSPSRATLFIPGIHCGTVIFDRWGGCTLYCNGYVMYVSEKVKAALRPYSGQSVQIDATEIYQPMNPGDALIKQLTYLGPAPPGEDWLHLDGLHLTSSLVSKNGEKPCVQMTLTNTSTQDVTVFSRELAPTLFTRFVPSYAKIQKIWPGDGPSFALLTSTDLEIDPQGRDRNSCLGKFSWRIQDSGVLPHSFALKPSETRQIHISFDLPAGEYDFLDGYGGEGDGCRGLASNLTAFNVDKMGNATGIAIKGR